MFALRHETDGFSSQSLLFVASILALRGGDNFVELGNPTRDRLELLNTEKQTPGHAFKGFGVMNRVTGGDLTHERQLAERTGGEALVHQSIVHVHVRDTVERDAETGTKA